MRPDQIKEKINSCLSESDIAAGPSIEISSLELVVIAVKLENAFNIKFDLDEIGLANFSSVDKIQQLIQKKL